MTIDSLSEGLSLAAAPRAEKQSAKSMTQRVRTWRSFILHVFEAAQRPNHLLNHLIRSRQHVRWNCQTDLFCAFRLMMNSNFWPAGQEGRRVWHLSIFCPRKQRLAYRGQRICSIGHETALIDKLLLEINCGKPMLVRKLDDPLSFGEDRSTGECDKCAGLVFASQFERRCLNSLDRVESRSPPILA